jgi:xylulokinase
MRRCILALDLGTSAFKAAPVADDRLVGRPTVVRYTLDYNAICEGSVTCDPERLYRSALKSLRAAAKTAREQGLQVTAIGISSQAQTYLALDAAGNPVQPAVFWTDGRAAAQAEAAAQVLPDFALTSGFLHPSPLQFLPKVRYFQRKGLAAQRFLLLNEWLIYRLTGEAYGDETNQGMGGFYDIQARGWSERALTWAGITSENLARVAPAASISAPLQPAVGRMLGLSGIPVYSCGNDQSSAAVGAGLERAGDILCNFGTALVVYAQKDRPVPPVTEEQIAGIGPMTSQQAASWFLLGLEPQCGNVFDWLAKLLYPRGGVEALLIAAFTKEILGRDMPQLVLTGGRLDLRGLVLGSRPEHLARAVVEFYAARFQTLLREVTLEEPATRLFASGGLSQNELWLEFLSLRCGRPWIRTACEHPGLVGIARIIQNGSGNGTSIRVSDL